METYSNGDNDQPTTCPKCGSRTEFEDHGTTLNRGELVRVQTHKCLNCNFKFILES